VVYESRPKGNTWRTSGGNSMYREKAFVNGKVGNTISAQGEVWIANLDGIFCGRAGTMEEAMHLVDMKYKEKYGG
jgi:hypothetical protein